MSFFDEKSVEIEDLTKVYRVMNSTVITQLFRFNPFCNLLILVTEYSLSPIVPFLPDMLRFGVGILLFFPDTSTRHHSQIFRGAFMQSVNHLMVILSGGFPGGKCSTRQRKG